MPYLLCITILIQFYLGSELDVKKGSKKWRDKKKNGRVITVDNNNNNKKSRVLCNPSPQKNQTNKKSKRLHAAIFSYMVLESIMYSKGPFRQDDNGNTSMAYQLGHNEHSHISTVLGLKVQTTMGVFWQLNQCKVAISLLHFQLFSKSISMLSIMHIFQSLTK